MSIPERSRLRPADEVAAELGVSPRSVELVREWKAKSALAKALPDAIVLWYCEQFLDYQLAYIFSDSPTRKTCWVKSRQIGGSFAVAGKLVGRALIGRRQVLVSASKDQALEVLEKCRDITDALEQTLGVVLVDTGESQTKLAITMMPSGGRAKGGRIIGRPANHRTARGLAGDVVWDEAGVTPFDALIFKGVGPVASRGDFNLDMLGTPFGDEGVFYDCAEGEFSSEYLQLRTTLRDAIRDGVPLDYEILRRMYSEEDFLQEFGCSFLESGGGYFPLLAIRAAIDLGHAVITGTKDPGGKIRCTTLGIDVGRQRDLTALCVLDEYESGMVVQRRPVEALHRVDFPQQMERYCEVIREHRPDVVVIDQGGMGGPMYEELQRRFGDRIVGVDFGGTSFVPEGIRHSSNKRVLIEHARKAFDRHAIALHPDDEDTPREFRQIKRQFTRSGRISYNAERNEDGHVDRATACILAQWGAWGGWRGEAMDVDLGGMPQEETKTEVQQWLQHHTAPQAAKDWFDDDDDDYEKGEDWDPLG